MSNHQPHTPLASRDLYLQSEDRESSRNLPRTFMECSYPKPSTLEKISITHQR
jgi:hypothetical protein